VNTERKNKKQKGRADTYGRKSRFMTDKWDKTAEDKKSA
jgi:hypothetical protein